MRQQLFAAVLAGAVAVGFAAPAAAANKEHQQLAADIRMLQEQAQQLQAMIGTLSDAIKAVSARVEEQANLTRKLFADQKLLIDTLTSDLRIIREKVDDNNVRTGQLSQQVEQLRQMVQALAAAPRTSPEPDGGAVGGTSSALPPSGTPAQGAPPSVTQGSPVPFTPPSPPAGVRLGASPDQIYNQAYADYASGEWTLAIDGFQAFIRSFPKSEQAADAQVKIGQSYVMAGNYQRAVEALNTAIENYPKSNILAEAYYQKGLALNSLKQTDAARTAFETVVKMYPDSAPAIMARQSLERLQKR